MSNTPDSVIPEAFARCDIGQHRAENQDRCGAVDLDERGCLLLVCDGMGGHEGGGIASELTLKAVMEYVRTQPPRDEASLLWDALNAATHSVYAIASRQSALRNMGSTCVAALVQERDAVIANVGDSRAYHLSARGAQQVTTDHTLLQQLVNEGHIIHDIENHPERNIITRCIGMDDEVRVDVFRVQMAPGDILLLCSDGLTAHVQSDEFALAFADESVEAAVNGLVDLANLRGGTDNIAIAALRLTPRSQHTSQPAPVALAADALRLTTTTTARGIGNAQCVASPPERRASSVGPARPRSGVARVFRFTVLALLLVLALIAAWLYFFFPCC